MDNSKKFDGRSAVYSVARPHYAEQLFEMLSIEYGFCGKPIADIGSGTGLFTEGLLKYGNTVYAVEPNNEMRLCAEEYLGRHSSFVSVRGDASHTGLKSSSVYAVTAAQAFHWFEPASFREECERIMYGKYIVLSYNSRAEAPIHDAVKAVNRALCPSFKGFQGAITTELLSDFFDGRYELKVFCNDMEMDEDTFVKRNLSSSYAPKVGEQNYERYVSEIKNMFARYSSGGVLKYPQVSKAYIGTIR